MTSIRRVQMFHVKHSDPPPLPTACQTTCDATKTQNPIPKSQSAWIRANRAACRRESPRIKGHNRVRTINSILSTRPGSRREQQAGLASFVLEDGVDRRSALLLTATPHGTPSERRTSHQREPHYHRSTEASQNQQRRERRKAGNPRDGVYAFLRLKEGFRLIGPRPKPRKETLPNRYALKK